jgi:sulfatase maturation enzyme AslB (radical SAM superfamily)
MFLSLEKLKTTLKTKYTVDCVLFLEDLERQPSSSLYKILKVHQQPKYADDYRFVFLNFSHLQPATLDHVVDIIDYLDISHYFVLLISNQSSTIEHFQKLTQPIHIQQVSFSVPNQPLDTVTQPLFNSSNHLCAHAWAGLHVTSSNKVAVCCDFGDVIKDDNGCEFDIREHTIDQILSSTYMKNLRHTFRQGTTPGQCSVCTKIESSGGESKRSLAKYKLQNIYGLIDWESDNYQSNLGYIGGHFGNLCNLKCRICSPFFSSVIAAEELSTVPTEQVSTHPVYLLSKNNNWVKDRKHFWEDLKNHVPKISTFEFLGGEPLLLKENLEFMQHLVDTGHSKSSFFEFTTNGTQYPDIFDQVDQFGRFTITVSIDNIDRRFEYERSGAEWHKVENNLEKFISLKQKNQLVKIGIGITVNIQNVFYIPELIQWLGAKNIDHYFYNVLQQPDYLSIDQLTPLARDMTLNKFANSEFNNFDLQKLNYVIKRVENSATSNGQKFCEYIRSKDKIRGENFANSHPEIAQAMGYVL